MINNLVNGALRVVPITVGNALTTTKNNILEVIGVIALLIVAGQILPKLSGGKKIAAIGGLVFGFFVIALISDPYKAIGWIKSGFSWFTGLKW